MTPFGNRIRSLRDGRGVTLKAMAAELGVSPAYISSLEHGYRGRPGPGLVLQICGYFNLGWDDAEELKRLADVSLPRVVIDTSGLAPEATEFVNLLARRIRFLDRAAFRALKETLLESETEPSV
jgi:transcriptional regulator with XRE-family HTH domain